MNDFDYEVLQRKRLAQQAKYRRNGSKSKKCSLLSDGMTHKQWKERNGEIMTYNLHDPMEWKSFKKMPIDVQKLYLENLRDNYRSTAKAVAEQLFKITPTAFSAYLRKHDISVFPRNGGKSSPTAIDEFLNGKPEEIESTESNQEPTYHIEPPEDRGMTLNKFTLNFTGPFNPDSIRNSLAMILEKGQSVNIEIICNVKEG